MKHLITIAAVGVWICSAAVEPASAQSSPNRAWGTAGGASHGGSALSAGSISLHQRERETAFSVEMGRGGANEQSSSACGACVYYTIQGNNNVISGNTANVSNSGDVQSTATFQR